jgi:hypothetical protein
MYYLEVKLDKKEEEIIDTSDFISNVISSQDKLGEDFILDYFEKENLIKLGFVFNEKTNGFSLQKDFTIEELKNLTIEVNKLKYHKLIHSYIELMIYNDELYFWDKALIYEGVDTFEYCLKYHNFLQLDGLNVLSKSETISEELLSFTNYTKRYSVPDLEFITQNCVWDKQEGYKILKDFILNQDEYLLKSQVIEY